MKDKIMKSIYSKNNILFFSKIIKYPSSFCTSSFKSLEQEKKQKKNINFILQKTKRKEKFLKTSYIFFANKNLIINLEKKNLNNLLKSFSKKFINFLMNHGEKAKALNIFYKVLYLFRKKLSYSLKNVTKNNLNYCTLQFLLLALNNIKPSVEIRQVRVAGITYAVPTIISQKKQQSLSIKWIIDSAEKRKKFNNLKFIESLAQELFEAFNKQGKPRIKRDELHKMAEANRAFVRYRWW